MLLYLARVHGPFMPMPHPSDIGCHVSTAVCIHVHQYGSGCVTKHCSAFLLLAVTPHPTAICSQAWGVPAGDPLVQPRGINRSPSSSYTYKGGGGQSSYGGASQSHGQQSSFVSPGKQTAKEAMRRARKPLSMKHCTSIIDGLKTIYFNKVW